MKRVLVCTDGEPHSLRAEAHAVELASHAGATVAGLYVQSTFLEKFTHEIYAVGRNECRAHLDREIEAQGRAALEALARRCAERNIPFLARVRRGDVAEEIVSEASAGYDLLVMGAQRHESWRRRLESVNVPLAVFKRAPLPMLFVR
jgi:nucleotide-binding universal stress UspA family protein